MPHSPHTISSRTISSVATNTSRVSPTLCHILAGEGLPAHSSKAMGEGGPAGGRVSGFSGGHRAPNGTGRHGRQAPLGSAPRGRGGAARGRQRPQGAGRRGADTAADRPLDPSSLGRLSAAKACCGKPYPLIAPGNQGTRARRPRRRPDALPWRTPGACG